MEIQTLWIIALSIATPIAGVVGFAIQLRQVKKAHLENEKLQLEIRALKERAAEADRRIVPVTNEEVLKVNQGGTWLSRTGRGLESRAAPGGRGDDTESDVSTEYKTPLRETLFAVATLSALALIAAYLVYDIYRLVMWIASKF
ncbi:MAG TPA: hypothetical protein VI279_02110 [Rhodocyclaceae bacterium]